jgi:hypothetical protein
MLEGDADLIEKMVFLVFFGWVLGLLGPTIIDINRKMRDALEIKGALKTELIELQYRLAISAYIIDAQYGDLNKDFLLTTKKLLDRYEGINKKDSINKLINDLCNLDDKSLKAYSDRQSVPPEKGISLKKWSVPLLDSKIPSLSWVNEKLRNQLLEINSHLKILDEVVDDARFYFNLTFQNISDRNHEIASKQAFDCYNFYSVRAKLIVNLIEKFLTE